MYKPQELLKAKNYEQLWRLCCGFLDLNIEQFMNIQKQLLLEQIELLKRSQLGRKVMKGTMPSSINEFRHQVPLTTYKDYCPELLNKNEEVLPVKPIRWIQTSGRSGEYPCKWIPVTEAFWNEAGLNFCAVAILGSCKEKYEINFKKGLKLLHAAAQLPCLTGAVAHKLEEDFGFIFFPPLQESENTPFDERINKGFRMALANGMDGFFGLAGILVAIGEKLSQGSNKTNIKNYINEPRILARLLKAKIKSKIAGRRMLPKDLFSLKVIASMGTDSLIYKEKIRELWGRAPLDVYGNTETTIIATQTWDYNHMVFFPNLNFLEFIPEDELERTQQDKNYTPKTILLDEVEVGKNYELVITNFHGGALVRYRLGDMIKITALENNNLGIKLPQLVFERRVDDLIDLGFMRLTERVIWQALEKSKIPYAGWTAKKVIINNMPKLYLYLELRNNIDGIDENTIASIIYEEIKKIDDGLYVYRELNHFEKLINFQPIKIILLPQGVFNKYKLYQQTQGNSIAHFRPPHINPSEKILEQLLTLEMDKNLCHKSQTEADNLEKIASTNTNLQ